MDVKNKQLDLLENTSLMNVLFKRIKKKFYCEIQYFGGKNNK